MYKIIIFLFFIVWEHKLYSQINQRELYFIQYNNYIHTQENEKALEILKKNKKFIYSKMLRIDDIDPSYKSLFLKKKKNLNVFTVGKGWISLLWTVFYSNKKLLIELLERNNDVNYLDYFNRNSLHVAMLWGNKDIIKFLLISGIKLNHSDFRGDTPMHILVKRNNIKQEKKIEILKLLFRNGAVFKKNNIGISILNILVKRNDIAVVVYLIKTFPHLIRETDSYGNNLIHWAASSSNSKTLFLVKKLGISINAQNRNGWGPIHWAIENNDYQVLNLIIKLKANINLEDKNKETALHQAIKRNKLNHTKILLRNRAKVNVQNSHGNTPLHLAVIQNKINFIKLLIFYRANKNLRNKKKQLPIDLAKTPEAKKLLLAHN